MDWLEAMCERVRNADDWTDGEYPKEAFDAIDTLGCDDNFGGSDSQAMLIQLLIDRVNELDDCLRDVRWLFFGIGNPDSGTAT
jgi:hypothetical protein